MLSGVVITHNAKDTIGDCIEALLRITDDVVIVDSGSSDGTKEICLSKPIRYVQKSWEGYAANKNFGNQLAKYDYILSVDSDEILSEELIHSILELKKKKPLADAYSLRFVTNFCGKWIRYGGWNPEWHVRIFDKRKIQWQLIDVHEILHLNSLHKIEKLKGLVLHYSYPTEDSHLKKIEKYTDLFAERAFKAQKRTSKVKIWGSAIFTFISNYLLKLGFLDGYYGFVVAKNNALYSYLKYKKLSAKWHNH